MDSTVPGQHVLPTLVSGMQTTASATVTNHGLTEIRNVRVGLQVPTGWQSQATSAASFAVLRPGESKTVTWTVTPPADATGGAGLNAFNQVSFDPVTTTRLRVVLESGQASVGRAKRNRWIARLGPLGQAARGSAGRARCGRCLLTLPGIGPSVHHAH